MNNQKKKFNIVLITLLIITIFAQQYKINSRNTSIRNEETVADAVNFPQYNFVKKEGTARIKGSSSYNFTDNKNFILILTLASENILKEYEYPIQLEGSIDSVQNPLIATGHKYGCVTLQTSGYAGSYVFDIEKGEGLERGPQYSRCVEWISPEKVIIVENIYNTDKVTYYVFDTVSQTKAVIGGY